MSLPSKYLKIVTELATSGALGAALLLSSPPPAAANQQPSAEQKAGVSERLAAIREAVTAVTGTEAATSDPQRLAWGNWWRNWGGGWYGRPWGNYVPWRNWRNGWNNWHNWRNW